MDEMNKGIDNILDKQYRYYIIDDIKYYMSQDINKNHSSNRLLNYQNDKPYRKFIKDSDNGRTYLLFHSDYLYYILMKRNKIYNLAQLHLSTMIKG